MEFIKQVERLQLLNKLVKEQRTGTPDELAQRLGVSRSKLYLILDELRDTGVCIRYRKQQNSFVYEECLGISLKFSFEILSSGEENSIKGGKYFEKSLSVHYFGRWQDTLVA
jgi:biotin operon repressor